MEINLTIKEVPGGFIIDGELNDGKSDKVIGPVVAKTSKSIPGAVKQLLSVAFAGGK